MKKIDESKIEYTNEKATWVTPLNEELFDKDVKEIINFFLVSNPCPHVSSRGVLLSEYGWRQDKAPNNGYLQKKLFSTADLCNDISFFYGNEREDMKTVFSTANMRADFYKHYVDNRIAMLLSDKNIVMSIFKHIRNAMAHFRFELIPYADDLLFVLENGIGNGNKFEVKARMIIKKTTMLKWIHIIKNDSKIANEIAENEAVKIDKIILSVIIENEFVSIEKTAIALGIEKDIVQDSVARLKESGIIERKSNKWRLKEKSSVA